MTNTYQELSSQKFLPEGIDIFTTITVSGTSPSLEGSQLDLTLSGIEKSAGANTKYTGNCYSTGAPASTGNKATTCAFSTSNPSMIEVTNIGASSGNFAVTVIVQIKATATGCISSINLKSGTTSINKVTTQTLTDSQKIVAKTSTEGYALFGGASFAINLGSGSGRTASYFRVTTGLATAAYTESPLDTSETHEIFLYFTEAEEYYSQSQNWFCTQSAPISSLAAATNASAGVTGGRMTIGFSAT